MAENNNLLGRVKQGTRVGVLTLVGLIGVAGLTSSGCDSRSIYIRGQDCPRQTLRESEFFTCEGPAYNKPKYDFGANSKVRFVANVVGCKGKKVSAEVLYIENPIGESLPEDVVRKARGILSTNIPEMQITEEVSRVSFTWSPGAFGRWEARWYANGSEIGRSQFIYNK